MKKPILATTGLAIAALILASCGAAPEDEPTPTQPGTEPTEVDTADVDTDFLACMISDEGGWNDASFNESAYAGLTQARDDLGINIEDAESTDASQYPGNIDAMVQLGCDLTFGVGFNLDWALRDGAQANEDLNFALIDSYFTDDEFTPIDLPNGKPILFNTHEAAYLAGYLAAGMTQTGTVATYGGLQLPSVTIFMDGFSDGIDAYNETHGTDVGLLGWSKENQTGSFTGDFQNQENGYNNTQQFINEGADIILPVAGDVGGGTLRAAAEHDDIMVIWVDSDGYLQPANDPYKQYILTSVLKELGSAVFNTIVEAASGEFNTAPYVGDLENAGVGLAPYHDFEDLVPEELKAEIETLQAQIISGELVVDSPSSVD